MILPLMLMLVLLSAVTLVSAQVTGEARTTATSTAANSMVMEDSLDLDLLDIEIQKARESIVQTDIWHRLIPRVSLSASLGAKDLFFLDPATSQGYLIPRDTYRLTLSLSLSDLLDASKHTEAILQMARLKHLRTKLLDRQDKVRQILIRKLSVIEQETRLATEELRMVNEIVHFRQMLFDQGKIHFDVLIRSKLDLLNATRSLHRLDLQQFELQLQQGGMSNTAVPEPRMRVSPEEMTPESLDGVQ